MGCSALCGLQGRCAGGRSTLSTNFCRHSHQAGVPGGVDGCNFTPRTACLKYGVSCPWLQSHTLELGGTIQGPSFASKCSDPVDMGAWVGFWESGHCQLHSNVLCCSICKFYGPNSAQVARLSGKSFLPAEPSDQLCSTSRGLTELYLFLLTRLKSSP